MANEEAELIASDAFAAIKAIIRRGVMTLMTLRDPDRRYLHKTTAWLFPVVNTAQESYGYARYGFEPLPEDISQMETVANWLAWLKRTEGEGSVRRIIGWTLGVPTWRLGTRERCSERTIRNRIDRSVAAIIRQFAAVDIEVEYVNEPIIRPQTIRQGRPQSPFGLSFSPLPGPHGEGVVLRKVYVYDKGFMIGGKRLRDGRERAEKYMD